MMPADVDDAEPPNDEMFVNPQEMALYLLAVWGSNILRNRIGLSLEVKIDKRGEE